MAINDSLIYALPEELIGKVSTLMIVLQALGAAIILYLIFSIINLFINKKKNKELQLINQNLEDIKKILISKPAK
jgi:hypothetical protein